MLIIYHDFKSEHIIILTRSPEGAFVIKNRKDYEGRLSNYELRKHLFPKN